MLESILPRGHSKAAFIFTVSCYGIVLGLINARLIKLVGLWPSGSDSQGMTRYLEPGLEHATILRSLLGPLLESLILIALIEVMRWLKAIPIVQVLVSTLVICLLHSTSIPIWGLLVAPTFLVDTASYVYWRRVSFWSAAQIIYIVHLCCNVLPFLTIVQRTLRQ